MKKGILGIWILQLFAGTLMAQGELKENPRIFYRNERSIGGFLNSNGWEVSGRFAERINARKKTIWEFGFANIKHPKEIKVSNQYNYNTRSFIYGKENLFINIRGSWGKQNEIFRKVDRGGISIRRYFNVGPTVGILKPIYYEVFKAGGGVNDYYIATEKFSTATHASSIYGRASFFKGIDEVSVVPGAFARFGMSFEYSTSDIIIHAIETAISIDVFPKKIPIMATEQNKFFFLTLSVGYRFGRVVDARGFIDAEDIGL